MLSLRPLLPLAALVAAVAAPSPVLAADSDSLKEPLSWQCGSTFTADVATVPTSLSIGGQPASVTPVDADTISFPAPNPAYAAGPAYGVIAGPDSRTVGVYRNGCFSPAGNRSDRSEGIQSFVGIGRGPVAGGDQLTVLAFGDIPRNAELYVGDAPATNVSVSSNGVACLDELGGPCPQPAPGELGWLIGGKTPPGAAGFADVSIRFGGRVIWGQTASSNDYQYVAPAAIESVTPAKGPLAGGNSVDLIISGDWVRDAQVTFGGTPSTSVVQNRVSGLYDGRDGWQRLTVRVPAGASAATVDVAATGTSILAPGPVEAKGKTATADDYTYEASSEPLPAISGFSGSPAIAGIGGMLVIRGTNLGGLRSVKVGTRTAIRLIARPNLILAYAPALPEGSYPVTVTTTKGTATATAPLVYR